MIDKIKKFWSEVSVTVKREIAIGGYLVFMLVFHGIRWGGLVPFAALSAFYVLFARAIKYLLED